MQKWECAVGELDKIILTLRLLGHPHLGLQNISDTERASLNTAADLLEGNTVAEARLAESRPSGRAGVRP